MKILIAFLAIAGAVLGQSLGGSIQQPPVVSPGSITLAGDVTGPANANTASKINGAAVPSSAPCLGSNSATGPQLVSGNCALSDVTLYGAACNGTTVDNTAFTSAISATGAAFVPAGKTCVVNNLELAAASTVYGVKGQSTIKAGSNGNIFTFTGTSGSHKAGLLIDSLSFITSAGAIVSNTAVLTVLFGDNVTMQNNSTTEIPLINLNPSITYSSVTSAYLCLNLKLLHNDLYSSQTALGVAIYTGFFNGGLIEGNAIVGFNQGIEHWGGDSGQSGGQNGAVANTRWAQNLRVIGNNVSGVGSGCIWGSMGQDVSYVGNTVSACGDEGLAFEGGYRNTATGNTCHNATGAGCLIAFSWSRQILFSGNIVTQDSASYPMFKTFNASQTAYPAMDVTVNDNTFNCLDNTNSCAITDSGGAYEDLQVTNNHLYNTQIILNANNGQYKEVAGNILRFNVSPSTAPIQVTSFGGTGATISGNTIFSTNNITSICGISVTNGDFNNTNFYRLGENVFKGFVTGECLISAGTNGSQYSIFYVNDSGASFNGSNANQASFTVTNSGTEHLLMFDVNNNLPNAPSISYTTGTGNAPSTSSSNASGTFVSTTTGSLAFTITFANYTTARNGWNCTFVDTTTPTDSLTQTVSGSSPTTASATGVTVTGDTIRYACSQH